MTYLGRPVTTETMEIDHSTDFAMSPRRQLNGTTRHWNNLSLQLDTEAKTYWCHMRPQGRPIYTHDLMQDVSAMQDYVQDEFATMEQAAPRPADWFVMASAVPGIYNLGGDLTHFAECIRARDVAGLRHYGHVAVQAVHRNTVAFDLPLVTMALVQGDALGGGFEHALSFDLIVAERSAKMGLPEILFNLFPGMGAYSFLSRRMNRRSAEEMILSGRLYTAEELHTMGVVDVLAEDGQGEQAVRAYIARHGRKHNAHHAVYRARRQVNPVTLDELIQVTNIWAEAAVNLSEADLRKMARLASAQDKRLAAMDWTRAEQPRLMASVD